MLSLSNKLENECQLPEGSFLVSKNQKYQLKVQSDGNLVLYKEGDNIIWSSNTAGSGTGPFHLIVQNDGNLCLYDGSGKCTWDTKTFGKGKAPFHLILHNRGLLALYYFNGHRNYCHWSTGTSEIELRYSSDSD